MMMLNNITSTWLANLFLKQAYRGAALLLEM